MKNDIKPTKEKFDENQNEIINLNDQMIKEISCSNDISQKNNETKALIEEHTKKIDKLNDENDFLKKEINETKEIINNSNFQIKKYVSHIKILRQQNKKIGEQFEEIIKSDEEMLEEIEKMEYLNEIVENNTKIIQGLS